jgi:hypothetical protein
MRGTEDPVLTVTGSSQDPYMVTDCFTVTGFSDNPFFFSLRDTVFSENPVTAGATVTGFSETSCVSGK